MLCTTSVFPKLSNLKFTAASCLLPKFRQQDNLSSYNRRASCSSRNKSCKHIICLVMQKHLQCSIMEQLSPDTGENKHMSLGIPYAVHIGCPLQQHMYVMCAYQAVITGLTAYQGWHQTAMTRQSLFAQKSSFIPCSINYQPYCTTDVF